MNVGPAQVDKVEKLTLEVEHLGRQNEKTSLEI